MITMLGYVRVSSDGQEKDGYGIDIQRDSIVKYCAQNGYYLAEIFVDGGYTGAYREGRNTLLERPGYQKMLATVKSAPGVVDGIVVLDINRLWRDLIVMGDVQRDFKENQIELFSINQPIFKIHCTNAAQQFMQNIMSSTAVYQKDDVVEKLRDGRNKAMELHKIKPAGKLPFGYRRTHDRKSVEIESDKAKLVQTIFFLASEKYTIREISEILRTHGMAVYIDEHNKSRTFDAKAISRILHNDYYVGVVTWSGNKIAGSHPALVSLDVWKSLNKDRTDIDSILFS